MATSHAKLPQLAHLEHAAQERWAQHQVKLPNVLVPREYLQRQPACGFTTRPTEESCVVSSVHTPAAEAIAQESCCCACDT